MVTTPEPRIWILQGHNVVTRPMTVEEKARRLERIKQVVLRRAKCQHEWVAGQCAKCAAVLP